MIIPIKKQCGLYLITVLLAIYCPANLCFAQKTEQTDDITVIKSRLTEPLLESPEKETITTLLQNQRPDGSWPDVDYADTSRSNWAVSKHLSHVYTLAQAYIVGQRSGSGKVDENLQKTIYNGIDYWYEKDYKNSNWWWNVIGAPGSLARILLLLDDELDDSRRDKGVEIIKRAKLGMTGANLVDVANITVMRGVIEKNPDVIAEAINRIAREICISTGEGIQPDFSFHQHGAILYNHGYGAVFMDNCSEIATVVAGTKLEFAPEKIMLLSALFLDGTRWMIRGATKDYGATGRGITRRSGDNDSAGYLRGVVANMLKIPTGRETEFRELQTVLNSHGVIFFPNPVNKHFWDSDFMTHNRPHFYASARMHSNRLFSNDPLINDEGYYTHHLSDGCTYIMKTGYEYHDIFPVWDWKRIPGTTVELKDLPPGDVKRTGTTSFVGGVSDGRYGLAAFDFDRDDLRAKKSWFFFDDEIVCLGAGISCASENQVVTTLNQCWLKGDVILSDGTNIRRLRKGDHPLKNPAWVAHDGIIYYFPDLIKATLQNDVRKGDWWHINHSFSRDEIANDVFTLSIEHGRNCNNDCYTYFVSIPEAEFNPNSLGKTYSGPTEIIANSKQIQAVYHKDLHLSEVVFYEEGSIQISKTLKVGVDRKCLVMLCEDGDYVDVSVSNPENEQCTVNVTVGRKNADSNSLFSERDFGRVIPFELPGGIYAGKTLTLRERIVPRN
ncbi:MAG: hypothetical protein JXB48_11700 [Candidatus Latescibacteria bacterium]|nr:hypothetical protein [Candidatus Latescibacterota bacterium]